MGALVACILLQAACSLPRGAALQSEVLAAANKDGAPFVVHAVTRETVARLQSWPRWHGYLSWVGSTRGPTSPVIRAGDRLDLIIWDNSENSLILPPGGKAVDMQGIAVAPDGSIFVPYLDQIYVRGMSPEAARDLIQKRMGEILPSAQIQLAYTAGAESSVSLVGGVNQPGTIPLPSRNFSILNLISQGGGVPPAMRNPHVTLVRGGRTYMTSLSRLYSDASLDVVLRGRDKVIVEQDDRYFQALGSTGREELIYFTKDRINALEAVSLVGGINDARADPKGVLILRQYPAHQVRTDGRGPARSDVVFTIDLTSADGLFSARRFEIEPQDVVLVTESPVTKAQTIFALVGSIFGLANTATALAN
ncbi:MAG: polysaccharide export protein [Rhodobacteraceae bacterium]|nr:polysaccharide export protein [Paracoccaceae bacterium]